MKVEVVAVGFDNDVIVAMQPPEGLFEFNYRAPTNDPL